MNLKHVFQLALATMMLAGVAMAAPSADTKPAGHKDHAPGTGTGYKNPDTDKDGKISAAEAKAAGISDEKFKKMDTNGDGFVTPEERKAARAGREGKEGKEGKEGHKPGGEGHKGPGGHKPEATPAPTTAPAGT